MASEEDPLGLVGTTVLDKYAIQSVVGQGGFAIVYRAEHLIWQRPVAVKVFKALGEVAEAQRAKLLEDFHQEGKLLGELSEKSTAIVQARDVGNLKTPAGDEVPYMVLEWLEGQNLESILAAEKENGKSPRSLDETIALLAPVAEALALAHKSGIAHRDVKPANVFVLDDGAGVKLLDFGIAKVVQDAQKMGFGKTAGHITSFTPVYGAPEQFNRAYGATGPWTDVFALALVAAEVMSLREPMVGDDLVQLAFAASNPDVRPTPRTLGANLSDEVEAVFRKAVAVKPEDRYQNAGDFWAALERAHASSSPPVRSGVDSSRSLSATALAATALDPAATAIPPTSPGKKSETPIVAASVVVVLVAGGAGLYALGGGASGQGPTGTSASASSVATSAASVAAPADAAPTCPPGMLFVPGGEFFMGSDEKDALPLEKPAHKVKLSPYCLDELEVTVASYKECSDKGSCRRAGKVNEWPGIKPAQRKIYDPLCNANDPVGKANHPINCVDWDQAREYCEARGARLPTEAEWEFAARGPDGRIYPWGDDPPNAKLLNACGKECVAWAKLHPDPEAEVSAMYDEDDGWPNTAPVGSFPAGKSRYGMKDVVGNVWEWVADWYADYDPTSAKTAVEDPKGPESGTRRVIRGGAWNGAQASWVRPSFRFHAEPSSRSYGFGFRCAKTP